jgi:hypothetical protein
LAFISFFISCRTELDGLSSLTNLEVLNLRGNGITTASQLASLSQLRNLRHLQLAGNPIEGTTAYPDAVFALLPSLRQLDQWTRPSPAGARTADHTPELSALQDRLDAMETAFSLQEQALSANGHELSQFCAVLAQCSVSHAKHPRTQSEAQQEETERLEAFPYYRLLQMWRKQALDSLTQRTIMEQQLRRAVAEQKRERAQLLERLREEEAASIVWRQKCTAREEQAAALAQALQAKEHVLQATTVRAERAEDSLARVQDQVRRTQQYLLLLKREQDQQAVAQAADVVRATEKLAQYEARVQAAAERAAFAAEMVAQKEVALRNSRAAIDAERRLMHMQRVSTAAAAHVVTEATHDDPNHRSDSHTDGARQPAAAQEGIHLSAEAEAFLKALFRSLDPEDSGVIRSKLLVGCLFNAAEASDAEDSATQQRLAPTSLGALLYRALGEGLWRNLSQSLLQLAQRGDNLTWGELLLQLLPSAARAADATREESGPSGPHASSLTAQELQALRQLKLLGDADWGVLPLQLPAPATAGKAGASLAPSGGGSSSEVRRLQQERSYLLNRLQRMSRSLELRAEGIKQYFQDTIRREEIKRERAVAVAADLEYALKTCKAKQAELEVLLAHSREAHDTKVPALEAQIDALQQELELRQSEALAKYRALLAEESAKVATLENQLLQAKSASDKKDNRCRCLENDVRRLREAQDQAVKSAAELKEQLGRAAAEQAQATQELHKRMQDAQEGCELDKRRLSEVIAEQQVITTDLRSRLAAAETECATAKSAFEAAAAEQAVLRKEVLVLQRIHEQYSSARASEPRGGGLPPPAPSATLSQRGDATESAAIQPAAPAFVAERAPTGSSHLLQRLQGIARKLDQPAH